MKPLIQSAKVWAKNIKEETPKAKEGIKQRVKETITNKLQGAETYNREVARREANYQKAQKALEKAKSVLRSITKGWWS